MLEAGSPKCADENLRPFATDAQWRDYTAWVMTGSYSAAARETGGCDASTIRKSIRAMLTKASRRGYAPAHDLTHPLPEGLKLAGTSVLYDADGRVNKVWNKSKQDGREPDEVVKLADPKVVSKLSTLYDAEGKVTQQWVSERPEAAVLNLAWEAAAKALAETLPPAPPVQWEPAEQVVEDVLSVYPVGDHHLGMLAWNKETGGDYDLSIGEGLLRGAADYLFRAAPDSEQGLVAFLGDFMHYDSFKAVTPTSGNVLDADGRFPKMVKAAIRSMRYVIEAAARKHRKVRVIVEIGNHDLASSIFLMEALSNIYENSPGISIDTSPMHYHYFEFGANLIGTHHGHGPKPDALPLIMATDRPNEWGRTKHRYWYTGHIHHFSSRDFVGCTVESFRVLPTADAWSHQMGYRSRRDMKAIFLHREHGEVARNTVTPGML